MLFVEPEPPVASIDPTKKRNRRNDNAKKEPKSIEKTNEQNRNDSMIKLMNVQENISYKN